RELIGGRGFASRLAAMGLAVGAHLEVLDNRGHGPLLISVRDTRVALGRREAQSIIVEKLSDE
ncbi:MAG: FeoA family protein, partial [Chloroflexota bacterium]